MIELLNEWSSILVSLVQIGIFCFTIYLIELAITFFNKAIRYLDKKMEYLEMRINTEKNNIENTDKK